LHVLLGLVSAGQHGDRDGDGCGVVGINHGGVSDGGRLEGCVLLRGQVDNLATPAEAEDTPGLDGAALRFDVFQDLW
jgi:hypothetical protein